MINITKCEVTDDASELILEASVLDLDYYTNVYIDSIIIDTEETSDTVGIPSAKAIYTHSIEGNEKSIALHITAKDLGIEDDLSQNIFFVYFKAKGTPAINTPCGMDDVYTLGIAFYKNPLYEQAMMYMRVVARKCELPKEFIDLILKLKAFEIALKTKHYLVAFQYWKMLFKEKEKEDENTTGCKCGNCAT